MRYFWFFVFVRFWVFLVGWFACLFLCLVCSRKAPSSPASESQIAGQEQWAAAQAGLWCGLVAGDAPFSTLARGRAGVRGFTSSGTTYILKRYLFQVKTQDTFVVTFLRPVVHHFSLFLLVNLPSHHPTPDADQPCAAASSVSPPSMSALVGPIGKEGG